MHDFSSCNSYCETCYTLKSVCTDCQLAGHNSYHPQLRHCDVCTLESKKCEKRAIFIMTSDCEEGNRQMFLKMNEQISDGEIDPNLSLLSPLPDCPHLGKSMKASFSNWYLKLDDERSNLSFLYTLRNSSDKEEMQIMRKLLPKNDYVRNKDRQDPISVLKLSQPKLTEYIDKIGYVGHTVIPKSIKFSDKNKVGMYPCPISITVDEQCFLYFLSLDTKTGKSKLYKTQLHNPVQKTDAIEKDLTARQVFYSNDHLFLCGFGTDISFVKLKHYSLRTFSSKKL